MAFTGRLPAGICSAVGCATPSLLESGVSFKTEGPDNLRSTTFEARAVPHRNPSVNQYHLWMHLLVSKFGPTYRCRRDVLTNHLAPITSRDATDGSRTLRSPSRPRLDFPPRQAFSRARGPDLHAAGANERTSQHQAIRSHGLASSRITARRTCRRGQRRGWLRHGRRQVTDVAGRVRGRE
jgi:hypothetical protein